MCTAVPCGRPHLPTPAGAETNRRIYVDRIVYGHLEPLLLLAFDRLTAAEQQWVLQQSEVVE
ncbi:hypothetical protein [uncultured Friedmanniella sp.]|uniref:hypothetical protein n=1 Tax=uncultured Friedmanniella sp. TaxID=335381 RepID=UPI0035CA3885